MLVIHASFAYVCIHTHVTDKLIVVPVRLRDHLPAVPRQRVEVAALHRLVNVEEDDGAVLEHHQCGADHGLVYMCGW